METNSHALPDNSELETQKQPVEESGERIGLPQEGGLENTIYQEISHTLEQLAVDLESVVASLSALFPHAKH